MIIFLFNPDIVIKASLNGLEIFKNNVFPTLFPFFVISSLLINYNFADILSNITKNIFYLLFKVNKYGAFIFILSLLTGFPSSAKNMIELYNQKLINKEDIEKILMFTHFANPLFIIGSSITIFDKELIPIILISHYIPNIIIGLIFRNYNKTELGGINTNIKISKKNFGLVLSKSISDAINACLLILGIITFFMILISLLELLNLDSIIKTIISGLLEMTNGIKNIASLNIAIKLKLILFSSFLSWGGFSIHIQLFSMLTSLNIKYNKFLLARLIHTILSILFILILYQ